MSKLFPKIHAKEVNLTAIRVAMDNIRTYKGKNLMNQRDDGIQTGIRSAASIAKFEQWVHSELS